MALSTPPANALAMAAVTAAPDGSVSRIGQAQGQQNGPSLGALDRRQRADHSGQPFVSNGMNQALVRPWALGAEDGQLAILVSWATTAFWKSWLSLVQVRAASTM